MITRDQYHQVRALNSFKELNREEFDLLASKMVFRQASANHILFFEGDPRDRLFILLDGYVKLEQADQSGQFLYMDYVKSPTLFPYSCLFIDKEYPFTATSISPISYIFLPLDLYETCAANNLQQMKFLYRKLAKIFYQHELRIRNTITSSAKERVIQSLALLHHEFVADTEENTLPFAITTIDLAQMSGTTRETVSHVLKELRQNGLIHYRSKSLTFLDKDYFTQQII